MQSDQLDDLQDPSHDEDDDIATSAIPEKRLGPAHRRALRLLIVDSKELLLRYSRSHFPLGYPNILHALFSSPISNVLDEIIRFTARGRLE